MRRTRRLEILAILALAIGLVGCGATIVGDILHRVQTRGVLIAATNASWLPRDHSR